jgi:hypothetical protein
MFICNPVACGFQEVTLAFAVVQTANFERYGKWNKIVVGTCFHFDHNSSIRADVTHCHNVN